MTALLTLDKVSVSYGRIQAVREVSVSIDPGQIVTIIGPNGAGKTTLMLAAIGLLPSIGAMRYEGEDLADVDVEARVERGMCLVPERRELFHDMNVEDNLTLGVTLSMAATPLLLLTDDMFIRMRTSTVPDYEMPPEAEQHVIIAGFGRFGQIVARVLRARHIPFTALDTSSAQVDFVKRYGATIYFGDAGRIDILRAAGAEKATSFVLAIRDVEDSLRIAEMVRKNFPDLPIYARARDRTHVHKLMDLGVTIIEREMFLAALDLTGKLLRGLGLKPKEAKTLIETFKRHDQERLFNEYEDYTDEEKMRANALTAAVELQELFARDIEALEDGSSSDETSDGRGSTG